jgi:hypothetical protein
MKITRTLILMTSLLLAPVSPAIAYIGPGAGISVLGSLLGILATIFVAIGAIIFWPVRKYMQRRKARHESQRGTEAADTGDNPTRVEVKGDDSQG